MKSILFLVIASILSISTAVTYTNDINIEMVPADELDGESFDTETHGKNIMFLMWDGSDKDNIMFKTSAWDMLHTQKDIHVQTKYVMIGEVDCSRLKNKPWCEGFIAFNISKLNYPIIGYSFGNEPFKHYNGSMAYPDLTRFLHEYFERSCVRNKRWCDAEEEELLKQWRALTLRDKLVIHAEIMEGTKTMVDHFESYRNHIQKEFRERQDKIQKDVAKRDKQSNLLMDLIQKYPRERIQEAMRIIQGHEMALEQAKNML